MIKNGIWIIMEHLQFSQSTMCNIKLWIIGELCQYYSIIQMELGEGKHHNTLKFFMNTILCHIFTKLFQICTDHSVLGKYFQVRNTSKWNYYRECGQAGNSWACSQGMPLTLVPISDIDLVGAIYRRFPLTYKIITENSTPSGIKNLSYGLIPLSCQSHRDTCFLKFNYPLYAVLFYNFVCNYLI